MKEVPTNRRVVCPICNAEVQVRSGMAGDTLSRHIKSTHKKES